MKVEPKSRSRLASDIVLKNTCVMLRGDFEHWNTGGTHLHGDCALGTVRLGEQSTEQNKVS